MINNEYKGNDIIGGASVNTSNTHQKNTSTEMTRTTAPVAYPP